MPLQLRELGTQDEKSFMNGFKDWVGESPHWYSFAWKEGMTYSEMLEILRKERLGLELAPGRVPHTMLYGFLGEQIVGRVSVRHCLNKNLEKRGGHIGYAVSPTHRKNGYAKEMVRQALPYCQSLGIQKLLITCSDTNVPSWKLIEGLGAELEGRDWDEVDQEVIRKYWLII